MPAKGVDVIICHYNEPSRLGGAGLCPSAAHAVAGYDEALKEGADGGTMGSPVPRT
jgi:hypothetical protein